MPRRTRHASIATALAAALASASTAGCSNDLILRGGDAGGGPTDAHVADATATDGSMRADGAASDAGAATDAYAPPTDAWSAPDMGPDCSMSASGTSGIWTCTSDHTSRQRCVSGHTQTEVCTFGACVAQPSGTDDYCPPDPSTAGMTNAATYCPGGNCVHWWNCRVTYQYQYTTSRDWDTDFHMVDGTPIILPHRSQLSRVYLVGSGFQPEFTDLDTGEWMHFNHLHLNSEFGGDDHAIGPVQLVSMTDPAHPDHIYPAGWVVGFSGGGTTRTGYLGTDSAGNVCTGGHSTAAHFCAVTHVTHSIDYYLPNDGAGCPTMGWPSALWSMIHPSAPDYASCPSTCTGCGVAHF